MMIETDQRKNPELAEMNRVKFSERLDSSKLSVLAVGAFLYRTKSLDVLIRQPKVTPSFKDRMQYVDDGDILLGGKYRVEVKQSSRDFSSLEDFPFPLVTVCEVQAWERAPFKPVAIFIVNTHATGAILIKGTTKIQWVKWSYETSNYEGARQEEVFRVPRVLLEYVDL